jgi:hypothetical protein
VVGEHTEYFLNADITFIAYANKHSDANPVGELHRRINGKDPIPENHGLSEIELPGE